MSPRFLREAINDRIAQTGRKPKAIIPVHLYGMPARMDEILAIADGYGIPVLEDAAEALGSEYRRRKCGTFGEFACLSFNGNKMITTSAAGRSCAAQRKRQRGRSFLPRRRGIRRRIISIRISGTITAMSNISAGIGRGQMYVAGGSHCAPKGD